VKRSELIYVIIGLLLAGIVGGLIGEIIGSFLPAGTIKTLFTASKMIGFDTGTVEFYSITLSFSLLLHFNFVSVLMMLFVLAYFRWWYL